MKAFKSIDLLKIGNTVQMAGAVYLGDGHVYIFPFPEDAQDVERAIIDLKFAVSQPDGSHSAVVDMTSDDWTTFLRQTDLMETEVLANAPDGKIVKAIMRKSQRQIDQGVSWQVWKRDGYRCRYCGNDSIPLTVDHLVPWEALGPSIPENLVSACRKCNKVRGNKTFGEWLRDPFYEQVSQRLTEEVRRANIELLPTLEHIPRSVHMRSR